MVLTEDGNARLTVYATGHRLEVNLGRGWELVASGTPYQLVQMVCYDDSALESDFWISSTAIRRTLNKLLRAS